MDFEEIKRLNIYEKMSLITEEMGVVEKGLKVNVSKTSSYKAVSERDILDNVKPLEKKYRVYSYPVDRKLIDKDILVKENDYGKTNTLYMRLEITYRFVNMDNPDDYIDIKTYGDGLDTGDKAPGKAMTYGDKYALMKGYKISTGDDPDKEASPEKGYKTTKKDKPTDERLLIMGEIDSLEIQTNTDHEEMLRYYKVNSNVEMTLEQLKDAKNILIKKLRKQNIENLNIPMEA